MREAFAQCWVLLLAVALLMLGNGLHGTLLGVRATLEGFATAQTGFVMSGYFAGFLVGSIYVPAMMRRVGHIRVFAALASVGSGAVLLHSIFIDPWWWVGFRCITGFCFSGLYVVTESWLNGAATNRTRGQLLSLYMVVTWLGMSAGQYLLSTASPSSFELFVLVSVLVSLSLVPVALTPTRAPPFDSVDKLSVGALYRISPLGVVGICVSGCAHGGMLTMGAVFAQSLGMSTERIAVFMSSLMLAAMVAQWPVGWISDRFDRRSVIVACASASVMLAAAAALTAGSEGAASASALVVLFAALGACSLPMYSLFLAHTSDHLEPAQIMSASSSLVLMNGVGMLFGPPALAFAMGASGPAGFFWMLGALHLAVAGYAGWRMLRRDAPLLEDQHSFAIVAPRSTQVVASAAFRALQDAKDADLARLSGR